ncbi:Variant-specific surface protein, partial [Giardia duodenalis]
VWTISALLAIYLAVGALAADCSTSGTAKDYCAQGKCEMIGEIEVCTQCKTGGNAPIDGVCVSKDNAASTAGCAKKAEALDTSSTICEKCTQTGYFLYKGGCYKIATPPESTICKAAGNTAGICEVCQAGYFKNPASTSDATKQSCIACNDTTGADSNTGVANCATCDPPKTPGQNNSPQKAVCTKCAQTKYLKDGTCVDKTGCTPNTEFAKEDSVNGNKCISCGDATDGVTDCKTCTAPSGESTKPTCTECNNNKIVKMEPSGTSCVEEAACVDGFFVETVSGTPSKKCTACADSNCAVCKK